MLETRTNSHGLSSATVPIEKMIVIGDSGVGKTNLITQYCRDQFSEIEDPTVAVQFFRKKFVGNDGISTWLHIWDTGGQERFNSITETYYRGVNGAIVVFDLTNEESFHSAKRWFNSARERMEVDEQGSQSRSTGSGFGFLLIGNKADLRDERVVSLDEAEDLAEELGVAYIETSALENTNCDQAFEFVAGMLVDQRTQKDAGGERECEERDEDELDVGAFRLQERIDPELREGCCFGS